MRVGVLSDTHIPEITEDLPSSIYKDFSNIDLIIHAGDIVDLNTLKKLKKINVVEAVCGNMDYPEVRKLLKQKEIINVGGFKIGIFHGWGPPSGLIALLKGEFKNQKVDCIVFGHSHNPVSAVDAGVLYFNPGSPTDKIFAPYNSYGILEISDKITGKIIKI
jgi:putative phosphoesterase